MDGNFIIGPTHNPAPDAVQQGVPQGDVYNFTMARRTARSIPALPATGTFGAADPADPARLDVTTSHPKPYTRRVGVYVPKQYVPEQTPFLVGADGLDRQLFTLSTI